MKYNISFKSKVLRRCNNTILTSRLPTPLFEAKVTKINVLIRLFSFGHESYTMFFLVILRNAVRLIDLSWCLLVIVDFFSSSFPPGERLSHRQDSCVRSGTFNLL